MKANHGKFGNLGIKEFALTINEITSSQSEKLLGITLDSELKFEEHISKISNTVNKKINVVHCIVSHMSLDK